MTAGGRPSRGSRALRWLLAALLTLDILALLAALSLFQVSSEATAERALRHAVAALTEVDSLLDESYDDLRERAASGDAGALRLENFPVDVTFSRDEVVASDRERLRSLLLDRAAGRLYEEGPSAFGDADGIENEATWQAAVRRSLDVLREDAHPIFLWSTVGLAAAAIVLAAALALAIRSYGALFATGLSLSLAGLLALGAAGALYFLLDVAGPDDRLAGELSDLARALLWAPARNSLVVLVLGLAFAVSGAVLGRWQARRDRPAVAAS